MGFRFRRSLKIAPGIRLNFSKRGTSLSLGGRGFTTNISKRGTKTTVGLPGTGISYSTSSPRKKRSSLREPVISDPPAPGAGALVKILKIVFFILLAMLVAAILGTLSRLL
jgi:hypothetical protein